MKFMHRPVASEAEQAADYDSRARRLSQELATAPLHTHAYGPHPQQQIEIYRPAQASPQDKLPVLVFLHGGAWMAGGLEWCRFMAPAVTSQGMILAIASYRLAPEHRWPAQLDDTIALTQWVQNTCEQFGGDPQRLALAGHSAGGHLVAMAVLGGRIQPVRACLPISGPMDLRYGRVPSASGAGRVYRYLLAAPEDDTGASPICALENNRTPFHLTWGEHDFERIVDSNHRMAAAMESLKQAVSTTIVRGANHFDTHLMLAEAHNAWYQTLRTALS